MPADSEPPLTLPRTYRPLGLRRAVSFWGGGLVGVCGLVWWGFGPQIRGYFTPLQVATLVLMGAMLFACYWGLVRSRVAAIDSGLIVVNGFRTHHLDWAQVITVNLRRGAPWAHVDLADGSTLSMLGIQGSDGQRALDAVAELRQLVDAS